MRSCNLARTCLALLLGVGSLEMGAAAHAQEPDRNHYISGYAALGGGGDARGDNGFGSFDLNPTGGIGARYEYGILDVLTVGAAVEWTNWGGKDRNHFIDISPIVRGRHTLAVGDFALELHLSFLVGLTIAPLDDNVSDDGGIGINLGGFVGGTFFVTDQIGILAEIGIQYHRISADSGGDFTLKTTQLMSHLGVVIAI
ncbi:MAG: hypothetical protein AAGE52_18630 [Myxococcota bacterium]